MITNIAENHLDVHGTMENYISAKQNIYRHQAPEDFLVLNYDDPITRAMAKEARGKVFFFSMENRVRDGAYLKGGDLIYVREGQEELILPAASCCSQGIITRPTSWRQRCSAGQWGSAWKLQRR